MSTKLSVKVMIGLVVIGLVWIPAYSKAELVTEEQGTGTEHAGDIDLSFDSVSVSIEPFPPSQPEHVKIRADGTSEYLIDEPGARLVHKLDAERLQQVQQLLKETAWLTAPGWEGSPRVSHPTTYTISIVRHGQERTITCHGESPEPYKSLIWFFRGVAHQENLLYRLGWVPSHKVSLDACDQISRNIEALQGQWGRMYPLFDVDYSRYVPLFKQVLQNPYNSHPKEILVAIKLLAFLNIHSERDHIVQLAPVLDRDVRRAAVRALGDLEDVESISVLAELIGSTDEAAWSLIRLGEAAVPTIVHIIEQGILPNDPRSEKLVRSYLEHWQELPDAINDRVIQAVRKGMAASHARGMRTEYYKGFLELAENDPVPARSLSCLINQDWVVQRNKASRVIHGWYTVAEGKIVEHGTGPIPEAGTGHFQLKFSAAVDGDQVNIEIGWQPMRGHAGERPVPVVAESHIKLPPGASLKGVYTVFQRRKFANEINPVRVANQYRTLWERWLIKDGRPIKRIVYVARVADEKDAVQEFVLPVAPAVARSKPPQARSHLTFRGVELTKASKVSSPAILHDLAVAGKNYAIKAAGGTPGDASKTVVIYKSPLKEASGCHGIVFHDPEQGVFYIQVRFDTPEGKCMEYHGPFKGNPFEQLKLHRPADELGL